MRNFVKIFGWFSLFLCLFAHGLFEVGAWPTFVDDTPTARYFFGILVGVLLYSSIPMIQSGRTVSGLIALSNEHKEG